MGRRLTITDEMHSAPARELYERIDVFSHRPFMDALQNHHAHTSAAAPLMDASLRRQMNRERLRHVYADWLQYAGRANHHDDDSPEQLEAAGLRALQLRAERCGDTGPISERKIHPISPPVDPVAEQLLALQLPPDYPPHVKRRRDLMRQGAVLEKLQQLPFFSASDAS
jgi:hypothetical protein